MNSFKTNSNIFLLRVFAKVRSDINICSVSLPFSPLSSTLLITSTLCILFHGSQHSPNGLSKPNIVRRRIDMGSRMHRSTTKTQYYGDDLRIFICSVFFFLSRFAQHNKQPQPWTARLRLHGSLWINFFTCSIPILQRNYINRCSILGYEKRTPNAYREPLERTDSLIGLPFK